MSGRNIRCVVFDIDDTLYLERDYARSGFEAVGSWVQEELGLSGFAARCWSAFEAGSRGTIFDGALTDGGVDPAPELVGQLVRVYRTHEPAVGLLPDARACLEGLQGRVRLAAVTGGPPESQRAKVRALDLERWLGTIVFADELGARFRKPSVAAFQRVQEQLGGSGFHFAYVADHPGLDFAGPASIGWATVRIRRAGGLHEQVPSGPDVLAELRDLSALELVLGITRDDAVRTG